MKVLLGAFNKEKTLVGIFSVTMKTDSWFATLTVILPSAAVIMLNVESGKVDHTHTTHSLQISRGTDNPLGKFVCFVCY